MKKGSLIASFTISLALFIFIAYLVKTSNSFLLSLDKQIAALISAVRPNLFVLFMKFITALGDRYVPFMFGLIVAVALIMNRQIKDSIFFSTTMLLGWGLKSLVKFLIDRPRPLDGLISVAESSFPSGHAMLSLLFFSLCAFYLHSYAKTRKHNHLISGLAAFIVLAVGFSRIYLGVHWFSDVIGGYLLGLSVLSFAFLVYKKI